MGLYDKLNWFAPETSAEDWGIVSGLFYFPVQHICL